MTKKCKCPPKKVDFTIMIPEGIEMGSVEVYQVAENGKPVNEFRPSRVDSDWDSDSEDPDFIPGIDSDEDDPDYIAGIDSDDDDPYEDLPFTDAEKQELRDELASLIIEQMENDESED